MSGLSSQDRQSSRKHNRFSENSKTFFEAALDNPFGTELKAFIEITELISLNEAAKDPKRTELERKRAKVNMTARSESVELELNHEHYKRAFQNITTLVNRLKAARDRDKAGDKYRPVIPVRETVPNLLQNIGVRIEEIKRSGTPKRFQRIFARE